MTHRIGLERRLGESPDLTETRGQLIEVDASSLTLEVGLEKTELALVGPRGAEEAVLGQTGSGNARDCSPARVEALCPGAFLEEHLDARCGAARDPLCSDKLVFVEVQQPAGGDR